MYIPKSFQPSSVAEVEQLIESFPLATLITPGRDFPAVTHLPLVLESRDGTNDVLIGHMARANPHWQEIGQASAALAVFQGPDHYVTPSWYPSKQEHGRVVPTWNYTVVHVTGTVEILTEPAQLLSIVETITSRMESARERPWAVTDAPAEYIEKLLSAIVGCRLTIRQIEAKWKLSQNQSDRDYEGVRAGLLTEGNMKADAVSQLMQKRG